MDAHQTRSSALNAMHGIDHPSEEQLEMLVLSPEELDDETVEHVVEHVNGCAQCVAILSLLARFHGHVETERSRSEHVHALLNAIYGRDAEIGASFRRP